MRKEKCCKCSRTVILFGERKFKDDMIQYDDVASGLIPIPGSVEILYKGTKKDCDHKWIVVESDYKIKQKKSSSLVTGHVNGKNLKRVNNKRKGELL